MEPSRSRKDPKEETEEELDARLEREENERLEEERKAKLEAEAKERERRKAEGGVVYKGKLVVLLSLHDQKEKDRSELMDYRSRLYEICRPRSC